MAASTGYLSPVVVKEFMADVGERAQRRPLAHVRGRARFRNVDLVVDHRVFVPRQETELLVEAALGIPLGARVLEPCTGSGAVAIALALERPDLGITASDVSVDALRVARHNADRHHASVEFVRGSGISGVAAGPFDAVVCNPPYVAETDRGTGVLPPELERHEPGTAFWAGPDGMDLYRQLIGGLTDAVGWVAFEVGDGQHAGVEHLLERRGLLVGARRRAPSGDVRVVVAER
jgi:release factor glutamine methyltransferase